MPRDGKVKQSKDAATPVERKLIEFTDHLYKKLCNDEVFPKRSRWLFSGKIADLANDLETAVDMANEIRVVTKKERDERHYWQTMAYARLLALDAKINQAGRVLNISADTMEYYAGLADELKRLIQAWINSDIKRYGPPTGLEEDASAEKKYLEEMVSDFSRLFQAWAESQTMRITGGKPPCDTEGDSR